AKADEDDKILGLEGGADDYITKPFSKRELLARVKAQLRRNNVVDDAELIVGDLSVNLTSHQVTLAGEAVHLGPTEYRLLEHFLKHQDRVYSREQLLNRIWRNNPDVDERTVDVHIRRLRKALAVADYDKFIHTVRGAGYRFTMK
ncbi:MAG: DNA-binding response regulator, partial [Gammaproteobacteria bacterium]|nr:DNA-binding response regulator [Gammaproteobacteria bacterium]